jgi:hypothetical protein
MGCLSLGKRCDKHEETTLGDFGPASGSLSVMLVTRYVSEVAGPLDGPLIPNFGVPVEILRVRRPD